MTDQRPSLYSIVHQLMASSDPLSWKRFRLCRSFHWYLSCRIVADWVRQIQSVREADHPSRLIRQQVCKSLSSWTFFPYEFVIGKLELQGLEDNLLTSLVCLCHQINCACATKWAIYRLTKKFQACSISEWHALPDSDVIMLNYWHIFEGIVHPSVIYSSSVSN